MKYKYLIIHFHITWIQRIINSIETQDVRELTWSVRIREQIRSKWEFRIDSKSKRYTEYEFFLCKLHKHFLLIEYIYFYIVIPLILLLIVIIMRSYTTYIMMSILFFIALVICLYLFWIQISIDWWNFTWTIMSMLALSALYCFYYCFLQHTRHNFCLFILKRHN